MVSSSSWQRTPNPSLLRLAGTVGLLLGTKIESARLMNENADLSMKLATRALIERAKYIFQCDLEISEEDAYRTMQLESQHRNKRMSDVAEAIIMRDELKHSSRRRRYADLKVQRIPALRNGQGIESRQSKN